MKRKCCVAGCFNTDTSTLNGKSVAMHSFPSDPTIRARWLDWVKSVANAVLGTSASLADNFDAHAVVCSAHFNTYDYNRTDASVKKLKLIRTAVPSIVSSSAAARSPTSMYAIRPTMNTQDDQVKLLLTALNSTKAKFVPLVKQLAECDETIKRSSQQIERLNEQLTNKENQLNYLLQDRLHERLNAIMSDASMGNMNAVYLLKQISSYKNTSNVDPDGNHLQHAPRHFSRISNTSESQLFSSSNSSAFSHLHQPHYNAYNTTTDHMNQLAALASNSQASNSSANMGACSIFQSHHYPASAHSVSSSSVPSIQSYSSNK